MPPEAVRWILAEKYGGIMLVLVQNMTPRELAEEAAVMAGIDRFRKAPKIGDD